MKNLQKRIGELDFLRGLAIIIMIYIHLLYDLKEFYDYPWAYNQGLNYYLGKFAACLFIILTGFSCALSKNNPRRALKILFYALLLSRV